MDNPTTPENLRAFIALDVGTAHTPLSQTAVNIRKYLPKDLDFVQEDGFNFHLSLKFLGTVNIDQIMSMFGPMTHSSWSPTELMPIHLKFEPKLNAFPSIEDPRIIWAGVHGDGIELLKELQTQVSQLAHEKINLPAEVNPFHPHVTLGRVYPRDGRRKLNQEEAQAVREAMDQMYSNFPLPPLNWTPWAIRLMHSIRIDDHRAIYREIFSRCIHN